MRELAVSPLTPFRPPHTWRPRLHTPLLHILANWDGTNVTRLLSFGDPDRTCGGAAPRKLGGPVLFTLPSGWPSEYERGGEYFEVNEAAFRRRPQWRDS